MLHCLFSGGQQSGSSWFFWAAVVRRHNAKPFRFINFSFLKLFSFLSTCPFTVTERSKIGIKARALLTIIPGNRHNGAPVQSSRVRGEGEHPPQPNMSPDLVSEIWSSYLQHIPARSLWNRSAAAGKQRYRWLKSHVRVKSEGIGMTIYGL